MRASVAGREISGKGPRAAAGGWSGAGASGREQADVQAFVRRRPPRGGRHFFCVNAGPSASPRTPTAGDSPTSPAGGPVGRTPAVPRAWRVPSDEEVDLHRHPPQRHRLRRRIASTPATRRRGGTGWDTTSSSATAATPGRARRGGPPLERASAPALTAAAPRTTTTSTELASASSETSTRTAPPTRSRPT